MSNNRTKNFSQKGFTSNFLSFMKRLEKNELCCLDFLERIFTEDSSSIHFSGEGTEPDPLSAITKLSSSPGNALTINSDGLFVPLSSAGLSNAINGLRVSGTTVLFANDSATPTGPANQIINSVYNQNDFSFIWLTGGSFFNTSWDATTDMDSANNSEIFGARVINKVQRNDTNLIFERKVVRVTPTDTEGSGIYHQTIDTSVGMPSGVTAALFGVSTSTYSFLMQMTTTGPNLNWNLAGPTVGGRTYNAWLSVVNQDNPFFFNPPTPITILNLPLYIDHGNGTANLANAINGSYTFGVDCDNKNIGLIHIATVTTGTHVLIEDGSGNYSRITLANLRTAMGL